MSESWNRADAKLKRLPIAVICEVVRRCQTPGVKQTDVVAWLKAEQGVSSSAAALSEQYTYLVSRVKAHEREQKIEAWQDCEKLEHPELSDEELFRRAQRKFSLLTIAEEDPAAWVQVQKLELSRKAEDRAQEELKLAARKVALAEANASAKQAVEEVGRKSGRLDPETKAEILAAIDQKLLGL